MEQKALDKIATEYWSEMQKMNNPNKNYIPILNMTSECTPPPEG